MSRLIQPVSSFGIQNPENQDFKNTSLSVIISDNGLSFLVIADNQPVAFEAFTFNNNFDEIIRASKVAAMAFENVEVIIDNRFFSFIPKNIAVETDKNSIFETLFGKTGNEVFFSQNNENDLVFGLESSTVKAVKEKWKNASFLHFAEVWHTVNKTLLNGKKEVFYHITGKYFYAALFSGNKLQLINSYEFSGKNDFGFFALGIVKNSGLDNRDVKAFVSGKVSSDSTLTELLNKYFPETTIVNFDNIPKEFVEFQHIIKYKQL